MDPERWENGSEFHWPGVPPPEANTPIPWSSGLLVSSGRDALRLVLSVGVRRRGWRRLWVPEYYCQQVAAALVRPGLELLPYLDDPLRRVPDLPETSPGDAVLVMNYFGMREGVSMVRREGVEIVEDHSHDPSSLWAATSAADFCIASLRKTLPLSDGGVLWSPLGHALSRQPRLTAQRRRTAGTKLAAMILKAMYLDGHQVDKSAYRALALQGEDGLCVPGVSAISDVAGALLGSFRVDVWRQARAANHAQLVSLLAQLEWARVVRPAHNTCVPFSFILVVDSAARRERVRMRLIKERVFPAVLWPLERTILPVHPEVRELSRTMLSIHCDGRYRPQDIERVAEIVNRSGEP